MRNDDFDGCHLGIAPDGAVEEEPELGAGELDMESETLAIVRSALYVFDGRIASTQTVVLADGVDSSKMRTGQLLVLAHNRIFSSATARCDVRVYNTRVEDDAPDLTFVDPRVLAQSLEFKTDMTIPECSISALAPPIGPQVRVVLEFRQGGTAVGPQFLTISVYLVSRRGL